MENNESANQKQWNWIHRALVILGVVVFIPLIYLGTAPFAVKAMLPALDSSGYDGLFMKGFEIYFWPIEKVCDWWPWYEEWGGGIVDGK